MISQAGPQASRGSQRSAPPRGRPPKAPHERLSVSLSIRVTPAQADAAYRYAMHHGEPLDGVFRRILVRLLSHGHFL